MDAQDFRSLQEAYNQVYQVDEELTGERKERALKKGGYLANRVATGREGQPVERRNRSGDITMRTTTKAPTKRGGGESKKVRKSDWSGWEADRGSGNKAARRESYDLYDIILSHLLDEGYAETVESAEAIMVNMSEDWRYHILEEVLDEENERGQRRAAARNMIDRHRTMTKGVSPEDRTGPEGYLRHRAKTERPTTLRNTSSAGQRRAAARNAINRSATMSKGVSPEDRTGPEGYLRHRAKTGG